MRFTIGACAILVTVLVGAAAWAPARLAAQRGGMFMGSADGPPIDYSTAPLDNVVERLNRRLQEGSATLTFEGRSGYLRSVLDALGLPTESQLLVFTKLSLQGRQVSPANPRALFFDDRAMLGWVRDASVLEVAAHDRTLGMVFYTLEQRPDARPVFTREFRCLGCHENRETLGVPGLIMFSSHPVTEQVVPIDQRDALAGRWGGWFVTGAGNALRHLGNQVPGVAVHETRGVPSVAGRFDPDGYPSMTSDVAALLTFSHQTHMTNLLTRAAWEARVADPTRAGAELATTTQARVDEMLRGVAAEVVDYMLFVGEAPLPPNAVNGRSPFAGWMSAKGPRDRRGRSLYELDLRSRLMRFPCSYLIYSPAFDALPSLVKAPIYRQLWHVLSGEAREVRYRALSLADRRAIVDILKDTKPDLPEYFGLVTR
ncbi:MAG: hypothetical protein ABL982_01695 [Vicinamibacterales bacterium]